jgi:cytosine/adenosine deaminase-related metal-dependent hydrolase
MNKKLLIPDTIVTADSENTVLRNHGIIIDADTISDIPPISNEEKESFEGAVYELPGITIIPGFVQTHVHLCQTLFRGLADDLLLLDWLQKKIFPYENAHNAASLAASAKLGLFELLRSGTTTILDFGTLRYQEVIFSELLKSGIRAVAGNCLIDENSLMPEFSEPLNNQLNYSAQLAKEYHNDADGRLKYAFTPRFALSSSEELLKESKAMQYDFPGTLYHTHASENRKEVDEIKLKTGLKNIEYLDSLGLLDHLTVLAHCIHVNIPETLILKERGVKVAHCPSTNLKLGSGIAPVPDYLNRGIAVSLGADGPPCNNNLSPFMEMRMAALIQKPIYGPEAMDALTVFRLATIEGAKALQLDSITGSIEKGKKADFAFLNIDKAGQPLTDSDDAVYSAIVYSANENNVIHTMVNGEWLMQDGKPILYDEQEIRAAAKEELDKLLVRAG